MSSIANITEQSQLHIVRICSTARPVLCCLYVRDIKRGVTRSFCVKTQKCSDTSGLHPRPPTWLTAVLCTRSSRLNYRKMCQFPKSSTFKPKVNIVPDRGIRYSPKIWAGLCDFLKPLLYFRQNMRFSYRER